MCRAWNRPTCGGSTPRFKFYWKRRFIGFGLTENFANFDNTPDIGFHFTIGGFVN